MFVCFSSIVAREFNFRYFLKKETYKSFNYLKWYPGKTADKQSFQSKVLTISVVEGLPLNVYGSYDPKFKPFPSEPTSMFKRYIIIIKKISQFEIFLVPFQLLLFISGMQS